MIHVQAQLPIFLRIRKIKVALKGIFPSEDITTKACKTSRTMIGRKEECLLYVNIFPTITMKSLNNFLNKKPRKSNL